MRRIHQVICECPPAESFDDLPFKPGMRTPLDNLGFRQKCCNCIPLRAAAIMICIVSFMWAGYELHTADKFMASIFPDRGVAFYYCKLFYLLWAICFVVACGFLMLGIIIRRFEPINIFVWYAFIFCCANIIITIGRTFVIVLTHGSSCKIHAMSVMFGVIWSCLYLYFVMVINSYKLILWWNICECPPSVKFDDLPIKPGMRTPLDKLGFPQKCCYCMPLRAAAIMICIVSFMWAGYELQTVDKFMASIFPDRGGAFYYCKIFYVLWAICFIVACGLLMFGIIIRRFEPVNIFIWYAFIFCCANMVIIIGSTVIIVLTTGSISKMHTMKIMFGVIWSCIYLYFVMVVNSYKLLLW